MGIEEIIKEVSKRELTEGCYDIKVDGISIYNYVRRPLFERFLRLQGYPISQGSPLTTVMERRKSKMVSLLKLSWTLLKGTKVKCLIYSFPRVEKVNGLYIDKFTDPIIDSSSIGDSYIIFEQGRAGSHKKPRVHKEKLIYTDAINRLCDYYSKLKLSSFHKAHATKFEHLFESIERTYPQIDYDKSFIIKTVFIGLAYTKIFKTIFKRLGIKKILAPSRNDFLNIIPAAKQCNIPIYELQHGITHGESVTYSGYKDPLFTPDLFLAFGEMSKTDKYGIDIDRIKVIGYAFNDYLLQHNSRGGSVSSNDVLIVSDPNISDKMVSVCTQLAKAVPTSNFYYRAHPGEILTDEHKRLLYSLNNVHINDNTENLLVVLQRFTHVIGENSTAIYEALSMGKKVGKIYMCGLNPKDLDGNDQDCFWRIEDEDSFKEYISAAPDSKLQRKIYSKFNKCLFESIIGQ